MHQEDAVWLEAQQANLLVEPAAARPSLHDRSQGVSSNPFDAVRNQ
jgi:hypothetical protein